MTNNDSGSDFFEVNNSDPDYFIQEYTDSCPKHPWNDKDGCTACDYISSERCSKHSYELKKSCAACELEKEKSLFDMEGFWDYPVSLPSCLRHPNYDRYDCPFCVKRMCEIHPKFGKENCWVCLNRCPNHYFYSKSSCPHCNIKKCVHGHEIDKVIDDECAYCYMIKHKNHYGKMLDWF